MTLSIKYPIILLLIGLLAACGATVSEATPTAAPVAGDVQPAGVEREPDVPPLPFADNPDPSLCGIPQPWESDEPAYLSGVYDGVLIQLTVYLYDSHLRRSIKAQAPHGTEVRVLLSQSNPELDYYLVKIKDIPPPNEGWVPAPFLTFEPPPPADSFEQAMSP